MTGSRGGESERRYVIRCVGDNTNPQDRSEGQVHPKDRQDKPEGQGCRGCREAQRSKGINNALSDSGLFSENIVKKNAETLHATSLLEYCNTKIFNHFNFFFLPDFLRLYPSLMDYLLYNSGCYLKIFHP